MNDIARAIQTVRLISYLDKYLAIEEFKKAIPMPTTIQGRPGNFVLKHAEDGTQEQLTPELAQHRLSQIYGKLKENPQLFRDLFEKRGPQWFKEDYDRASQFSDLARNPHSSKAFQQIAKDFPRYRNVTPFEVSPERMLASSAALARNISPQGEARNLSKLVLAKLAGLPIDDDKGVGLGAKDSYQILSQGGDVNPLDVMRLFSPQVNRTLETFSPRTAPNSTKLGQYAAAKMNNGLGLDISGFLDAIRSGKVPASELMKYPAFKEMMEDRNPDDPQTRALVGDYASGVMQNQGDKGDYIPVDLWAGRGLMAPRHQGRAFVSPTGAAHDYGKKMYVDFANSPTVQQDWKGQTPTNIFAGMWEGLQHLRGKGKNLGVQSPEEHLGALYEGGKKGLSSPSFILGDQDITKAIMNAYDITKRLQQYNSH